jgi:hypothetical protein
MPSALSVVSPSSPSALASQETINKLQSQITAIEAIIAKMKSQN